ncbi:MAG: alkane 1-monooxygenase, partial [Lysobacterales bacterium]
MTAHRPLLYLLAYIPPALLPLAAWLGLVTGWVDAFAWLPLVVLFVVLPIIDAWLGADASVPPDDGISFEALQNSAAYRWLTIACVPLQWALLAWSLWHWQRTDFGVMGSIGWVLSLGVVGGVLAINVAHELIHKAGRVEPFLGGLLLASVGYAGFKIEHLRGHHVHVATPLDPSTARLGESSFEFVMRGLLLNPARAWRIARTPTERVELLVWHAVTLTAAVAFGVWLGAGALLAFLAQALIAAGSLEVINYVEHYGLTRDRCAHGRFERISHAHSWNSNFTLTNVMLFQLQRHADHHAHPRRRYQSLRHHPDSPQLPAGYSAMFL